MQNKEWLRIGEFCCAISIALLLFSCGYKLTTDDGGNYFSNIEEFHSSNFFRGVDAIEPGNLS